MDLFWHCIGLVSVLVLLILTLAFVLKVDIALVLVLAEMHYAQSLLGPFRRKYVVLRFLKKCGELYTDRPKSPFYMSRLDCRALKLVISIK